MYLVGGQICRYIQYDEDKGGYNRRVYRRPNYITVIANVVSDESRMQTHSNQAVIDIKAKAHLVCVFVQAWSLQVPLAFNWFVCHIIVKFADTQDRQRIEKINKQFINPKKRGGWTVTGCNLQI